MTYKAGMIVEGKVTGIQPYGIFVSLDYNTNGLIHISEISDGFVRDISRYAAIGDVIKVKIIDFDPATNHAKLSLKAIARTHSRNRKRTVTYKASLPPMKIGFQSIASNMNQWIREAEKDLLKK